MHVYFVHNARDIFLRSADIGKNYCLHLYHGPMIYHRTIITLIFLRCTPHCGGVTKNFPIEPNKFRRPLSSWNDETVNRRDRWSATRRKNQGKRITRRCRLPVPEEKWISSVVGTAFFVKMTLIIGFSFDLFSPQKTRLHQTAENVASESSTIFFHLERFPLTFNVARFYNDAVLNEIRSFKKFCLNAETLKMIDNEEKRRRRFVKNNWHVLFTGFLNICKCIFYCLPCDALQWGL